MGILFGSLPTRSKQKRKDVKKRKPSGTDEGAGSKEMSCQTMIRKEKKEWGHKKKKKSPKQEKR